MLKLSRTFVVENPPTYKQYIKNMEEKMSDNDFLNDTSAILREGKTFNPIEAYDLVREKLIEQIKK